MVNKKQLDQRGELSSISLAAADNAEQADRPAGAVAMRQDRCVPRWGHEGKGREKQQLQNPRARSLPPHLLEGGRAGHRMASPDDSQGARLHVPVRF